MHIPKTGGESIETFFVGKPLNKPGSDTSGLPEKHLSASSLQKKYPHEWDTYLTFSIVRNPWDRVLSSFCYTNLHFRKYNRLTSNKKLQLLAYLLRTIDFRKGSVLDVLFIKGKIGVDVVMHFENLKQDFKNLCIKLGLPSSSKLPHKNKSEVRMHYSIYYTRLTREIVRYLYRDEIDYFGYVFEDKSKKSIVLLPKIIVVITAIFLVKIALFTAFCMRIKRIVINKYKSMCR